MKNVKAGHTKPIVCLDAGHYGKYNRSPSVPEYYESEMNWKLHLLLKEALEQYGIEVKQTRSNLDTDKGLVDRGKASNGCDLFLSIHSNAVGAEADENVDYVVAIVQIDGKGDNIGNTLAIAISETMGTKQKGRIWTRKNGSGGEYYGVLRGAASVGTVGMIIEHSFHTNTRSAKWLLDENNLRKLAEVESAKIAEWFDVEKEVKDNSEDVWYCVQVGAYERKENAEEQLAKVKAAGFDAYITTKKKNVEAAPESEKPAAKSIDEIALEVINGDWGNGEERKQKLAAAGYDYSTVQKRVNELLKG